MRQDDAIISAIRQFGEDIIRLDSYQSQKSYLQHGTVSVFVHCLNVAYLSLRLAGLLHLKIDRRALIRGALLHDYFLYDWHTPGGHKRPHGFHHAGAAYANARRDFELSRIERDIILKHMFPLNLPVPRYKESVRVCIADKICAIWETTSLPIWEIPPALAKPRPSEAPETGDTQP